MTGLASELQPAATRVDARLAWTGAIALAGVLVLSGALSDTPGTHLTRNTIRLSLAWYFLALLMMLRLDKDDWRGASALGRAARWCWTWGVVCFLVHLAMAFHFFHHWLHAHAMAHTREVSGVGEGIFASYLFTWLWVLDAAWWWGWPEKFAARSRWWDRCLHAYMLFIVFNGTIIFEGGPIRVAGAIAFGMLIVAWIYSAGAHRSELRATTTLS